MLENPRRWSRKLPVRVGFIGLSVGCCYLASHNAARLVCNTVSNSAVAMGLIFYGMVHGSPGVRCSHGSPEMQCKALYS